MLEKVRRVENVQERWEERSMTILRVGQEALSITAGRRSLGYNETTPMRHGCGMIRCRR